MNKSKRKILVPIFNRAHYGRLRAVLRAIQANPKLELQLMVASTAAYDYFWLNLKHSRPQSFAKAIKWYIRARLLKFGSFFKRDLILKNDFLSRSILEDGFSINARVALFFDGGLSETMAKSVGLGFVNIVDELKKLKPDIVFINADRFEMISIALAAAYLNIPIAHNEGGDVSGTLDESIRHAITKLAHIHFTSTETSRKRVLQMGEDPNYVFTVGSPAIDVISGLDLKFDKDLFSGFNLKNPYLLVLIHPVATEDSNNNRLMIKNVIHVLKDLNVPTIFLGSNIDAMSSEFASEIKAWRDQGGTSSVVSAKTLPPDDFYRVLANATCAIGNSSSFIREGVYFGTPVVLIGSRQQNRERGKNIIEVGIEPKEIEKAIAKQLKHGRYLKDERFGNGQASFKISNILANTKPKIQKEFQTLDPALENP